MDFVLDNIAIGSYEDAINLSALEDHDITAVLDLTIETSYSLPPSILKLKVPMEDCMPMNHEHIRMALRWLRAVAEERKVLVHCLAGISRSTTMVLCYLYEEHGLSFQDGYTLVKSKRDRAQPHPALLESVQAYYNLTEDWQPAG